MPLPGQSCLVHRVGTPKHMSCYMVGLALRYCQQGSEFVDDIFKSLTVLAHGLGPHLGCHPFTIAPSDNVMNMYAKAWSLKDLGKPAQCLLLKLNLGLVNLGHGRCAWPCQPVQNYSRLVRVILTHDLPFHIVRNTIKEGFVIARFHVAEQLKELRTARIFRCHDGSQLEGAAEWQLKMLAD